MKGLLNFMRGKHYRTAKYCPKDKANGGNHYMNKLKHPC